MAGLAHGVHHPGPRIGYGGRARVGHERHALARPEEGCDLLGALHFVVFPNGEQTNVDAEFVKQLARLSGILSYYGVSTGENPQGT